MLKKIVERVRMHKRLQVLCRKILQMMSLFYKNSPRLITENVSIHKFCYHQFSNFTLERHGHHHHQQISIKKWFTLIFRFQSLRINILNKLKELIVNPPKQQN